MSGHSKWSTIKRQKAVTDAKRGAIFTRLGNLVSIAARAGADPTTNSALAMAIEKAKSANMPLHNIERAIQRVADKSAAQLQEVMYEGYGPGGVAILVECATDNLNRTYPEVRHAFSKHGGSVAEKGAVAFQFSRKGVVHVRGGGDELLMQALDAGAEDVVEAEAESSQTVGGKHGAIQKAMQESIIYTTPSNLAKVRDALKIAGIEVIDAELTYEPNTTVEISDTPTAGKIMRLMDALDELDDVSATHTNFDIADGLKL